MKTEHPADWRMAQGVSEKPLLLVGLDPNMNHDALNEVMTQLQEQLPSFLIVVVAGMRYATVLDAVVRAGGEKAEEAGEA